jgi:hypothetical protein
MNSDLQKQFERMVDVHALITELKNLFEKQARVERFETTKALFSCKMAEGASVGPHVLKMIGYVDYLGRLDVPINHELATDLILQSLPESYDQFVMNFIMNDLNKSLTELHGMLKTAELNIKKTTNILTVKKGKGFKKVGTAKGKADYKGKKKVQVKNVNQQNKVKPGPTADQQCFYCKKSGHWKRNCKKYLEDKKNGLVEAETSGIYVIEVNVTTSTSWVLDTGCGSHICTNVQGLNESRRLAKGEVDLRVGNGARVVPQVVGTFQLSYWRVF